MSFPFDSGTEALLLGAEIQICRGFIRQSCFVPSGPLMHGLVLIGKWEYAHYTK